MENQQNIIIYKTQDRQNKIINWRINYEFFIHNL